MAQEFSKKSIEEKLKEASQSIEKSTFINQDISDKQLKNLTMQSQLFKNCNFYVSSLYGCTFDNCDFIDCNFSAVDFLNVKFFNCIFNKCIFDKAKMQDVLFDDCTKINCSMNELNIIDNVIGIDIEESKIITENDKPEKTLSAYEYLKEDNQTFIHISLDTEMGPGVYRIIIGDAKNPSIISDTITNTDPNYVKQFIDELIDAALGKTDNQETKASLLKLKAESYDDIFSGQLQPIEQSLQLCLDNIKQYPNGSTIQTIYTYLESAIESLKPLLTNEGNE